MEEAELTEAKAEVMAIEWANKNENIPRQRSHAFAIPHHSRKQVNSTLKFKFRGGGYRFV